MKKEQYFTPEIEITIISVDIITYSDPRGEWEGPEIEAP